MHDGIGHMVHTPWADTPPPPAGTTPGYGQCVGGTHPYWSAFLLYIQFIDRSM